MVECLTTAAHFNQRWGESSDGASLKQEARASSTGVYTREAGTVED